MNAPSPPQRPQRCGVVAVIQRVDDGQTRFLVIRRSEIVSAPGAFCFPGGGVDPGETEEVALPRELQEEVNIQSPRLIKRIWNSHSRRGVALAWWIVEIDDDETLTPDPAEVAEIHWWTIEEMRASGNLLDSNEEFLQHWEAGAFEP